MPSQLPVRSSQKWIGACLTDTASRYGQPLTSYDELPISTIESRKFAPFLGNAPDPMANDIYSELRPERQEIRLMFLEAGES
jgi:hypothetical protein